MIDWTTLPSLPALRAFEAAARLGSLSQAARSLNVTHAAIAQHVRALERHFGHALLERAGQGMAATPEGAMLAQSLTEGFATIAEGCNRLTDLTAERPLAISCTPSFAENWLMPRVTTFWARHPDIDLAIMPSNKVTDFRADRIDLAIRYGRGDWPGVAAKPLLTGDFIVTAAPGYLPQDCASFEDLQRFTWIMDDGRAEQHVLSRDLGLDEATTTVKTLATNGMVLAAARAGLGLAVQSRALAGRDLASGALVEVCALESENLGYWIVHPKGTDVGRLATFIRWLRTA